MSDQHDDLLQAWRDNAARDDDANFRFLRSLKMVDDPSRVDADARRLHAEVFAAIDCTRCANCCKTMKPVLSEADIERIAERLGVSQAKFVEAYLETDEQNGSFRMRSLPCPFLADDGRCRNYDVRPKVCREFPNTDKEEFATRTHAHSANALNCPAVYHIVTRMQRRGRGASG